LPPARQPAKETAMNAPETFPADADPHAIVVRDRRFGRGEAMARWWCNGDPIATAWLNSLSASFPRGEALFIESVKAFLEGAPPVLERDGHRELDDRRAAAGEVGVGGDARVDP
jgi:hypothetical protein